MVVDDERDVVTLIKFLLEKDGHQVVEAYNGAQALKELGIDPQKDDVTIPDLLIIDVMMPIVDGYTTCQKLSEHTKARSMPIIVLTAKGQVRDLFKSLPNISTYIEKPFDPKSLRETVNSIVQK